MATWCVLVVFGVRQIYGYSTTEGGHDPVPTSWPVASSLALARTGPTLIMFVHPECPCTRASLAELTAIAERSGSHARIEIVFTGLGETWAAARRILGASRSLDLTGEAARFGARTSGFVVVYDATGALRYAGGITGSRGHAGDNVGRRTVERILAGESERDLDHPVFGCGL